MRPHRRLAVTLKARQQPPCSMPLSIVLHPVRELRPGVHRHVSAEDYLRGLSKTELCHFFASWVESQATRALDARSATVPEATAKQSQSAGAKVALGRHGLQDSTEADSTSNEPGFRTSGVRLQSGSVLSVHSAGGIRRSNFFIELSWQAAVPKDSQVMLQSAESFLESGMPVELGPAIELPAASEADKSSWHEQSAQCQLASHPAENGVQSPKSAALLPVSGGTVPLLIAQHLHDWKIPPIAYSPALQHSHFFVHEPGSGAFKGPPSEAIAHVY